MEEERRTRVRWAGVGGAAVCLAGVVGWASSTALRGENVFVHSPRAQKEPFFAHNWPFHRFLGLWGAQLWLPPQKMTVPSCFPKTATTTGELSDSSELPAGVVPERWSRETHVSQVTDVAGVCARRVDPVRRGKQLRGRERVDAQRALLAATNARHIPRLPEMPLVCVCRGSLALSYSDSCGVFGA